MEDEDYFFLRERITPAPPSAAIANTTPIPAAPVSGF